MYSGFLASIAFLGSGLGNDRYRNKGMMIMAVMMILIIVTERLLEIENMRFKG